MPLSKGEIIDRTHGAFRKVRLGNGVGLFEARAIDGHEIDESRTVARKRDEKTHWSAIPVAHLNQCSSSLSFFDAEGMRFHLPAYMIADLRGELDLADPVFHLTYPRRIQDNDFALLSADQRTAVREYLLFFLVNDDQESGKFASGRALDKALVSYWMV